MSGIYKTLVKWFFAWVTLTNVLWRRIDGFKGAHGGYEIGKKNVKKRKMLEFLMKRTCVWKTNGLKSGEK